jgi:RimJ/RimL family protein N-acetyltransferase
MTQTTRPDGPMIQTPRLRLRLHRLDDLDARIAITSDPETMRFINGPQSPEENWNRLMRYAGHWALLGHGIFAVEERTSGRFAGEVGLGHFHRGLGKDFDPAPEAAWMIAGWATGQGYASEAIAAAMAWHERTFTAMRQVCIIDPDNKPSLRLAHKLGFLPYRENVFREHSVILHERLPADRQKPADAPKTSRARLSLNHGAKSPPAARA